MADNAEHWDLIGSTTDAVLDWIGELIARADGKLKHGGDELVIIPHRYLRAIPITHARLPGAFRLSDIFTRVSVLQTLLHSVSNSVGLVGLKTNLKL